MKNAIITGASSFLGVTLTNLLLQNDIEVFAVVRPNSKNLERLPKSKYLHILELDMENITQLCEMELPTFDVFYHLAWDGTRGHVRDDTFIQEINYTLSMNAVKTAAVLGCKAFVGAGSQAEYGSVSGKIDEVFTDTKPITAYGKAKLKVYHDGRQYAKGQGMRFVWPRIFSLYGNDDHENTLIMSCLRQMLHNNAIDLTPCTQMWDFLHVSDAAQAYFLIGESESADGIYHVASGECSILKDYVLEMAHITNSKSQLNFGSVSYPPEGAIGFEPVVNRLKQELNWLPQVTFEKGITDILHHMERHS